MSYNNSNDGYRNNMSGNRNNNGGEHRNNGYRNNHSYNAGRPNGFSPQPPTWWNAPPCPYPTQPPTPWANTQPWQLRPSANMATGRYMGYDVLNPTEIGSAQQPPSQPPLAPHAVRQSYNNSNDVYHNNRSGNRNNGGQHSYNAGLPNGFSPQPPTWSYPQQWWNAPPCPYPTQPPTPWPNTQPWQPRPSANMATGRYMGYDALNPTEIGAAFHPQSTNFTHPDQPWIMDNRSALTSPTTNQTHVSTILATHILSEKIPESNVVFSPLSIHVVLNILALGAKGPTLDQLLTFLKVDNISDLNSLYSWLAPLIFIDGSPSGGPTLSAANGVWLRKNLNLKPSFKEVVETTYKASCKEVDFLQRDKVAHEVNLWAEMHTNGLIKNLLNPKEISELTMLMFANALYFKGAWKQGFNKLLTENLDFHLLDGNKVKVPFMTNKKSQFVCQYDDFKVLGLPYSQGQDTRQFTMYIFLPDATDGLQSLVKKISSTPDFLKRHIPRQKVKIRNFFIPKFMIYTKFEPSEVLKELGLVLPFCVDVEDLTGLVDDKALYVSRIIQKSFVEVNEEGTEAAAVTIVCMDFGGPPMDNSYIFVDFVADHPFLFVIREDVSEVVLFMGHVLNPSVSSQYF